MGAPIQEILEKMSDTEAVRFLKHFGTMLFRETDREIILGGVSPETWSLRELKRLQSLDAATRQRNLGPEDSARVARCILQEMAKDEEIAKAIAGAWKTYRSDELFVESILAAGFVAGLLLFVATTEIEFEIGGVKFKKQPASADVVRAVAEPFFKALGGIQG